MDLNKEKVPESQQETTNTSVSSSLSEIEHQNIVAKKDEPIAEEEFIPCVDYLKGVCLKQSECLLKHQEFPCKYYHMGLICKQFENCKYMHGSTLSQPALEALLKHIQDAKLKNYDREFVKNVLNKYSYSFVRTLIIQRQSNLKAGHDFIPELRLSEEELHCGCACAQNAYELFKKWMELLHNCKMSRVAYHQLTLHLYKSIDNFEKLGEARTNIVKEIYQQICSLEATKNKIKESVSTPALIPPVEAANKEAVWSQKAVKGLRQRPKLRRRNFYNIFKSKKANETETGLEKEEEKTTLQNVENTVEDIKVDEIAEETQELAIVQPINVIIENEGPDSDYETSITATKEKIEKVTEGLKSGSSEALKIGKNGDTSQSEDKKPIVKRARSKNRMSVGDYFQNFGGSVGVTTRQQAKKAIIAIKEEPIKDEDAELGQKIIKIEKQELKCEDESFDSNIIPEIQSPLPEPTIQYKLTEIDIPSLPRHQPRDLQGLLRTDISDPRLKKYRLAQGNENRDPRAKAYYPIASIQPTVPHTPHWELKECIKKELDRVQQLSMWYKKLEIAYQFEVNNALDALTKELVIFHDEKRLNPHMRFNVLRTDNGLKLKTILNYLNINVDEYGKIVELQQKVATSHFAYQNEQNTYRPPQLADDMPYFKPRGFDGRPKRDFYNKPNQKYGNNFRGRFQERETRISDVKSEKRSWQEFKGFDNNPSDETPQRIDNNLPDIPTIARSPSPKRQQVQYEDDECWD